MMNIYYGAMTVVVSNPPLLLLPILKDIMADVLGVEVFRQTIAGNALVGSYSVVTNQGAMVHPRTSVEDIEELSALLQVVFFYNVIYSLLSLFIFFSIKFRILYKQVPVVAGTINRGSDVLGAGMVVNDWAGEILSRILIGGWHDWNYIYIYMYMTLVFHPAQFYLLLQRLQVWLPPQARLQYWRVSSNYRKECRAA